MINLNEYKNKIIAHRGIYNNIDTPENSLKAFKKALDKNYPIELDIHLTKDNNLIVFHDDFLNRMTNQYGIVEEKNSKELKKINLLNTAETIPTLKDVLSLINGKVLIDIEIKAKKRIKTLIKILLETLNDYNGDIIIKSFNPTIIKEIKRKINKYPVGLLISTTTDNKIYNILAKTNFFIPYSNPDFLAISKKMLQRKNIQKYLTKYPIQVWTIKNKEEIININNKNFIYICDNLPFKKD